MLDAPRVYRPVSALADYTEIIGHCDAWVSAVMHRALWSRAETGARQSPVWVCLATRGSFGSTRPAILADVPGAPPGYFVEAVKA